MEYPGASVWRRVLMSPKMLALIAVFLAWDHYVTGGAVPYLASCCCGWIVTHFTLTAGPQVEVVALAILVFVMVFITLRLGIESWFWKKLFLMEKKFYCILAVRDFANCWAILSSIMELVTVVYKSSASGLRMNNISEYSHHVFLNRLKYYGFPFDEPAVIDIIGHTETCSDEASCPIETVIAMTSAELSVAVALVASSMARLLYINSLYSYMSAVDLLGSLDPFLQTYLRSDDHNDEQPTRPRRPFTRPADNNPTDVFNNVNTVLPMSSSIESVNKSSTPSSLGWPLSFFREDIAESYRG